MSCNPRNANFQLTVNSVIPLTNSSGNDSVPALVVCDNCKQAVLVNKDWIEPELNKDYAEWAEHNHTGLFTNITRTRKYVSLYLGYYPYKETYPHMIGILPSIL